MYAIIFQKDASRICEKLISGIGLFRIDTLVIILDQVQFVLNNIEFPFNSLIHTNLMVYQNSDIILAREAIFRVIALAAIA